MIYNLETLLKAPFPVDSLSWRIGNKTNWDRVNNKPKDPNKPVKAQMLVYIDSRDVQDRLDEVCDLCAWTWENDFKEVSGRLVCNLTLRGLTLSITRSDGAGDTDFEAEKGGLSDALKRAAVLFGVGRYLYNAKNFNTWIKYEKKENGEMETDFDMPKKAKEELADVARQLGESVKTYHYWLNMIDSTKTQEEFEAVRQIAGKYAKREEWSAGNIETFKKHIEDKKKDLKRKKKMKYKLVVMNKKEPIMIETKDRIENEIPEIKKVFEDNGTGDEISELLYNHYSNQICCPKDEFKLIGWDLIKEKEDGTEE